MEVDDTASVGDLRRSLTEHATARSVEVEGGAAVWNESGVRLDDDHLVAGVGLCSGARVWLSPHAPPGRTDPVAVEFAIVGGPDLGPPRVLGPGRHRIGGSSQDDVPLLGARLPAAAVVAEIDGSGRVTLEGAVEQRGDDVVIGPFTLRIRPLVPDDAVDGSGGVPFNRTPYRPVAERARVLEPLPAPPSSPPPSKAAVASLVVPLASGVGFAVVLGRPQFLVIALLAPIVLLLVSRHERRQGRRSFRQDRADHLRLVDERVAEVGLAVEEERVDRLRALPHVSQLIEEARTRRPSLWERGRDAPDLLVLRLGTADVASRIEIAVESGGDDELRRAAQTRLSEAAGTITDAPVALDLEQSVTVGFHGDGDLVDGVVRSVLGQLLARHGPEDVVVVALLAPVALRSFEWLRWVPHVRSPASPLPGDHLAVWPEANAQVLGALLDVANEQRDFPRIVVIVHEEAPVDRAALGRLLDVAPSAGIRVIWVGRDEALMPRQCATVVRVAEGPGRSICASTDSGSTPVTFTAETMDGAWLDRLARHLAPLRDASSVARAGSIPRSVGLTDVLGGTPAPADVASAWKLSDGGFLGAPVGVGPDGVLSLDLVEQGPHALIAGTSGSGKSELLQSWVAAMAARHPPERLTFLFIDYKGGAAAAPFADIPHNVGVVTNLDPRLSLRALTSLRAELDRRMALLADRAADLAEFTAVDPEHAPPRLVLVVDEFATLVKEVPDFVAGIVDIAQRGRSLGIHLILATQRPAGAVNENILANTNLRIALRVVDPSDSQNVIGSPDAAEIPVPLRGRAFARIGPTDLVPFQVAWSGGPRHGGESRRVRVAPFGFGDRHAVPGSTIGSEHGTQLDDVVRSVVLANTRSGRSAPRRPWLPPLPEVVPLEAIVSAQAGEAARAGDRGRVAVIGLRDDPAHQRRTPAVVDLEVEGGLAVVGVGGSGRSTVLRTAAASLTDGASTAEVQLVVFDFASRALLPLLELPHTRAVVTADDLEATAREIEWLEDQVRERRTMLGDERVESLGALRARDGSPIVPRVIVVIDGFGSLRAELDKPASFDWLQTLQRVLVEGRQVGIHPIIAADRRPDVPNPALGALGARLALRMAEPESMVSFGVPLPLARAGGLGAGRGYLRGDEEIQVAVLGDDPAGAAQAAALVERGIDAASEPVTRATGLPLEVDRPTDADHGLVVALGVEEGIDGEIDPALVDLAGGHLVVMGPPGSGRSTALDAVRAGLAATGERMLVVAARQVDVDAVEALASIDEATVVLIDDADDLTEADARIVESVAQLDHVRVVASFDSAAAARAFHGLVPALKRGRRLLLLCPQGPAEIDQHLGTRVRLRPGATFPPGRGVLAVDRQVRTVQVGRPETKTP
ncbi:FtsK/SpoIIIE domain-containing protein [Actinospongicola halichondriae]|uniref:FtsK/SpoIIIE domain-containing protein n=1 Tax=Actinospongicola halichondriae TaxID=3236844 RepID=UPI003D3DD722